MALDSSSSSLSSPPKTRNSSGCSGGSSVDAEGELSHNVVPSTPNLMESTPGSAVPVSRSPSENASQSSDKKRKSSLNPPLQSKAKKQRQTPTPKKWLAPAVYTSKNSPIAVDPTNLREMLLSPAVWGLLDPEDHQAILAKLPDRGLIQDRGTPQARPDFDSLRNHDGFRHDVSRYCQNLSNGYHEESWLTEAWVGHHKQMRGDFDAYQEAMFHETEKQFLYDTQNLADPSEPSSEPSTASLIKKMMKGDDTSSGGGRPSTSSSDRPMRASRQQASGSNLHDISTSSKASTTSLIKKMMKGDDTSSDGRPSTSSSDRPMQASREQASSLSRDDNQPLEHEARAYRPTIEDNYSTDSSNSVDGSPVNPVKAGAPKSSVEDVPATVDPQEAQSSPPKDDQSSPPAIDPKILNAEQSPQGLPASGSPDDNPPPELPIPPASSKAQAAWPSSNSPAPP
ncbi:hypothetical protein QBC35DRAFT_160750 [Podospora australis]|uniref:ASX DEUBAD domain-containing protein n=1 Tax=Podospora australis TaxID=1536484 RepID=A0AAN7AMW6_9PEZI|nr:hypothetical protein QBC35DRAFT_160750 [Podospora australis]